MDIRFITAHTQASANTPGDRQLWSQAYGFVEEIPHGTKVYLGYWTQISDSCDKVIEDWVFKRHPGVYDGLKNEFVLQYEFDQRYAHELAPR